VSDEMPARLRELIAAERSAPVANEAVRAAIGAKLTGTLGIAPAAAIGAKGLVALKLVTIVGAVIGASAAIKALHAPDGRVAEVPALSTPVTLSEELERGSNPVVVSRHEVAPSTHVDPLLQKRVEPPSQERVSSSPRTVPRHARMAPPARSQRELLADATRSLSTDPMRALRFLDEDARVHPDGALAEERDALRLQCLLALGRADDARAAARRFITAYPNTIHQPLVNRALGVKESK
jgi:hypothetical protein